MKSKVSTKREAVRIGTLLLGIASVLIVSIIIEGARSLEAQAYEGSSGLKVIVNLYHNKRDSAKLCVYSYEQDLGCDRINLSEYASPIQWGPWTFNSGAVKVGSGFTACITNLRTQERECTTGTNGFSKEARICLSDNTWTKI